MSAFSVALWDGSIQNEDETPMVQPVWKRIVPPIWDALESMRCCTIPGLVVHGESDGMFPVKLGKELHACCGPAAQGLPVPQPGHNEPFHDPQLKYWGGFWTCAPESMVTWMGKLRIVL